MSKIKYDREQILNALNEKGTNLPCHRCGHKEFALIDGFSKYHLSDDLEANTIGGQGVPVVLIACNNCGAITPHAALALIQPEEKINKEGGKNGK
jgi:DNA-directed RNA polymerase subunit RPC12/RpoP